MLRSDLIHILQERNPHLHPSDVEAAVKEILDHMAETLAYDGRIEVRGFGSFVVKEYQAYQGRNPKTGEKISVPPKKLPFFKVGKELKERIDNVEVPAGA